MMMMMMMMSFDAFLIWNFRGNSVLVYSTIFCSYQTIWVVYDFIIAIFRLEVCDIIIMLQFVSYARILFLLQSIKDFSGIFDSFSRSRNRLVVLHSGL